MPDIETDKKQIIPEFTMDRETTPTCCTVETTEEGHGYSLVQDQNKTDNHQEQPKRNQKAKGKLIRSAAVCEEALPSEPSGKESEDETEPTSNIAASSKCEQESQAKQKECSTVKKHSLSKEPSLEYTDSTGIDLEEFLISTMKSSHRDRLMLLKLEQDMTDFMTDNCSYRKFPQMSSYHRMLVHRVAAYFGLEHNVDHSGKAIIINKTSNSRIPEQRFGEHVQEEKAEERRSILKRDSSQEKEDGQTRMPRLKEQMRSKSFEEREEEYQRARDRIFSQESSCPAHVYIETRDPEDCCNVHSESQRRRQLFRATRNGSGQQSGSRQSSFELECNWNDLRPWSSTDSESSNWGSKPALSHSDSNPKLFKPVTEAMVSNSPAYVLMPAETSILPRSILVNPHTGQPYMNADGTPAVYNPPGTQQPMSSPLHTVQPQVPPTPLQQSVPCHSIPQVQYTLVTYHPSQQGLPVSSSQVHPSEHSREDFSSQFNHMTLNHQYSGDTDLPPCYLHGAPPTQSYTQPQQNYAASFPEDSYMCSGLTPALPTGPPPQLCAQQSSQVSMYNYPGQCGNTAQQYGPASYSTQTGYANILTNQQQAYPSGVGTQVLPSTQKSIMGSYSSTSTYQMAPQLQPYSSTVLVSRQTGQNQNVMPPAGVPVYCNPVPASPPPPIGVGITCQSGNCRNTCSKNQNQCWY